MYPGRKVEKTNDIMYTCIMNFGIESLHITSLNAYSVYKVVSNKLNLKSFAS